MRILPYVPSSAAFLAHDAAAGQVAQRIGDERQNAEPRLQVEHIGSTSVPGCGGKGIIDLAVLYPEGLLDRARKVLDGLGFQKQGGPEPWPEERPMRVGCIEQNGHRYRIHAHVIALNCKEHHELIWFRDLLRRDSSARHRYEERKQAILTMGIDNSLAYCKAKGTFIDDALKERTPVV